MNGRNRGRRRRCLMVDSNKSGESCEITKKVERVRPVLSHGTRLISAFKLF